MNGHGGRRPGAGRKAGVANKLTQQFRAAVAASGQDPLEYMLAVMRDPKADQDRRDRMAVAAAPYLVPKLAVVDSTVRVEATAKPQTEEERREEARQAIRAAFAERPEPQKVIAGRPTLRVIEHEPPAEQANSEEQTEREG
jgi:hypothetical protein